MTMDTKRQEKNKTSVQRDAQPVPRPIPVRECGCGCGHEFQPGRRDQVYLNGQHADYAYNHGKRKERDKNEKLSNKMLKMNDNILDRHYKAEVGKGAVECLLNTLKAEGFNSAYHIGTKEKEDGIYRFTYNYSFLIHQINKSDKIKICKR